MIFCLSFKGLKIMIILAFLLFLFCVIMLLISIIKPKWGTLEKGVCQEFCVNRFNKQHRIAA